MNSYYTLDEKICKAIKETQHDERQYTDQGDGFANSTYAGLIEEVKETLEDEGFTGNIPYRTVEDFVGQLIN